MKTDSRRARGPWRVARIGLALLAGAGLLPARAAIPTLEHFHPVGLPQGTSNAPVQMVGKADPWPPRVWASVPGLNFLAETNSGRFRVNVAPTTPSGAHLVRLYHDEGASEPRVFVVGNGPEQLDAEPNDRYSSPQSVTNLPVVVTGRLDRNGDVDSFALRLAAGQWLDAALDGFVLMSKLDPVLRLVATNGAVLAWNHDFATLDPRLRWRAATDQTVILQVFGFRYPGEASIQLAGGDHAVYRLHLAALPAPPVAVDPSGATVEIETNDAPAQAQRVAWPGSGPTPSTTATNAAPALVVVGALQSDGDIDRFQFVVPSNSPPSTLEFRVEAASLGSPLDAWLRITDAAGKELAHVDDHEGSRDPAIEWLPPSPGIYQAAVGSLVQRGSAAHAYRLLVRPVAPDVEARVETSSLVVQAGATNELKFKVSRLRGHAQELDAVVEDLPLGVSAAPVHLKGSENDVTLRLVATTNAPASSGPIRIALVTARSDGSPLLRHAAYYLTSRGENNGVPQGWSTLLADRTDRLWLTVRPLPAPSPGTNAPSEKK